jgi:hypothetical protein
MLGQASGLLSSLFLLCSLHILRVSSHHHVVLCPNHSVTWLGAHRLHTHLLGLFAVYVQIITRLSGSFQLLGSVLAHWLGLFAVYVQIMMWLSGSFSCLAQCLHIGLAYSQCMFRSWCGRCTFLTEDKQRWHSLSLDLLCTFCSKCLFLSLHDPCIGPMHLPSLQAWQSDWTTLHVGILLNTIKAFLNACAFAIHVHKANWPQNHQTNNPLWMSCLCRHDWPLHLYTGACEFRASTTVTRLTPSLPVAFVQIVRWQIWSCCVWRWWDWRRWRWWLELICIFLIERSPVSCAMKYVVCWHTGEISCWWWEFCSRKIAEVSQISRCVESIHCSSKDRNFPSRHTRYTLGHTHCCLILDLFHHSLVFARGAREHTQVVQVFLVFARGAKEHTQVLQVLACLHTRS